MFCRTRFALLATSLLAVGTLALAQTPAPTTPAEVPVPAQRTMSLSSVNYATALLREPGDVYRASFRDGGDYHQLGTSRLQWSAAVKETQVNASGLRIRWVPVSLYVFPYVNTGNFTKTGAATVEKQIVPGEPGPDGQPGKPTPQYVATPIPTAQTTFRYTTSAVYGVLTANANHLFDWQASPLRTEHARAGIGVMWAKQRDITNGVELDEKNPNFNNGAVSPANAGVQVRTHSIELTRSITGGDPTWSLGYVVSWQQ